MNRVFIISMVVLSLAAAIFPQSATKDKTVEKIRAYYTDISEKARLAETDDDRGEFGDLVMNELVINKRNHQWRAVGIYGGSYKFFYKTIGEELYPETLVMVKIEKRVSARTYSQEFVFDERGLLIFYFQKAENDEQMPKERRIYFDAAKAIRVIEDGKQRDKLSAKDLAAAKEVLADGVRIKEVFARSIKL
jgi:hypothetical protein